MCGRLIVVEGLDGAGKTTLSKSLAAALGAEWTTTPGKALRLLREDIELALDGPIAHQLFYAASVVSEANAVAPALARGQDVVVDRYWASTVAYAALRGDGADLRSVERSVRAADVTIFLTLREEVRRSRLLQRGASPGDVATFDTERRERLKRAFVQALRSPLAGWVVGIDVSELDQAGTLRAVLAALAEPAGHRRSS